MSEAAPQQPVSGTNKIKLVLGAKKKKTGRWEKSDTE